MRVDVPFTSDLSMNVSAAETTNLSERFIFANSSYVSPQRLLRAIGLVSSMKIAPDFHLSVGGMGAVRAEVRLRSGIQD